jgi:hypothetical protein
VVEESDSEADSDLRRRAAWLLGMLAVVAVLFIIVMSQVLGGGDNGSANGGPRALDSAVGNGSSAPSAPSPSSSSRHSSVPAAPTKPASSSTPPALAGKKCPTHQTCVLDGDIGNGIAAVNDYRTQHGHPAVSGRVSQQAQDCALHNGSGCSGGWAETELAKAEGPAAVQKILQFAHLLDPNLKSFEVGWAYDPGAKLYYFAIIRND